MRRSKLNKASRRIFVKIVPWLARFAAVTVLFLSIFIADGLQLTTGILTGSTELYKNENYRFNIEHPGRWIRFSYDEGGHRSWDNRVLSFITPGSMIDSFTVDAYTSPPPVTLEDIKSIRTQEIIEYLGGYTFISSKSAMVNGITQTEVIYSLGASKCKDTYILPDSNISYILSFCAARSNFEKATIEAKDVIQKFTFWNEREETK